MIKNILIFGGTFDPVHNGHELFLNSAKELCRPDLTLVIPCNIPPHKQSARATDDMRIKMCEVLCKAVDNAIVYKEEIERGGKSYTIDTITKLKADYKNAKLYMCIGGDMLLYFRKWKDWDKLIRLVTLVVQNREINSAAVRAEALLLSQSGANIIFTQTQPLVVSSTQLRDALENKESVASLVPKGVNEIIVSNNLYKR